MRYRNYILGILLCTASCSLLQAQPLNFYYGNIHAHSSYSDGNKDEATTGYARPYQDFQYARHAQHIDFFGIAEHNHSQAGMQLASYAKGLLEADSANITGTFVAMYGMEYGVIGPPGGHLLLYGYNQLIGWESGNYSVYNDKLNYSTLWPKIANTPGAFASMAHPDVTDYDSIFFRPYNVTADSAIRTCAIRSGPAFSTDTNYNDPSTSSYESRYKDALKAGYHVGAILDHDNHYTTFGTMAKSRTVVLAPSLSRTEIMNAFRNRRTQSSDDWNVKVTFTINGHPLGSVFNDTANAQISISVTDPDLETVSNIKVNYGVPGSGTAAAQLFSVNSVSTYNYTHTVPLNGSFYYYAVITQADGDKIFTSPIWIKRVAILPVSLLYFSARATENNGITCSWETAQELNARDFTIERSTDGEHFEAIGSLPAHNTASLSHYDFADHAAPAGLLYYRLKETDLDGQTMYSEIVTVRTAAATIDLQLYPNPAEEEVFAEVASMQPGDATVELIDHEGRLAESRKVRLGRHTQQLYFGMQAYPAGLYLLRIRSAESMVCKKFIHR